MKHSTATLVIGKKNVIEENPSYTKYQKAATFNVLIPFEPLMEGVHDLRIEPIVVKYLQQYKTLMSVEMIE